MPKPVCPGSILLDAMRGAAIFGGDVGWARSSNTQLMEISSSLWVLTPLTHHEARTTIPVTGGQLAGECARASTMEGSGIVGRRAGAVSGVRERPPPREQGCRRDSQLWPVWKPDEACSDNRWRGNEAATTEPVTAIFAG